ncbi:MAG: hypothetical protein IJS13_06050 [Paludibacteraceae bacterium]|nr:hypothetical protein [Paludibacteraceae bacterium]
MYDTPLNENTAVTPHNFGEYIELYNAGEQETNLYNWQLNIRETSETFYHTK